MVYQKYTVILSRLVNKASTSDFHRYFMIAQACHYGFYSQSYSRRARCAVLSSPNKPQYSSTIHTNPYVSHFFSAGFWSLILLLADPLLLLHHDFYPLSLLRFFSCSSSPYLRLQDFSICWHCPGVFVEGHWTDQVKDSPLPDATGASGSQEK